MIVYFVEALKKDHYRYRYINSHVLEQAVGGGWVGWLQGRGLAPAGFQLCKMGMIYMARVDHGKRWLYPTSFSRDEARCRAGSLLPQRGPLLGKPGISQSNRLDERGRRAHFIQGQSQTGTLGLDYRE
jgi:hypothetical protein